MTTIKNRKNIFRDVRGNGISSHKLFLVKRSSMENTQIRKGYSEGTTSLFKLISIYSHPLK